MNVIHEGYTRKRVYVELDVLLHDTFIPSDPGVLLSSLADGISALLSRETALSGNPEVWKVQDLSVYENVTDLAEDVGLDVKREISQKECVEFGLQVARAVRRYHFDKPFQSMLKRQSRANGLDNGVDGLGIALALIASQEWRLSVVEDEHSDMNIYGVQIAGEGEEL